MDTKEREGKRVCVCVYDYMVYGVVGKFMPLQLLDVHKHTITIAITNIQNIILYSLQPSGLHLQFSLAVIVFFFFFVLFLLLHLANFTPISIARLYSLSRWESFPFRFHLYIFVCLIPSEENILDLLACLLSCLFVCFIPFVHSSIALPSH